MRLSSRVSLLALLALGASASRGGAQTVVDPTTAVPGPAGGANVVDVSGSFSGRYVMMATRETGEALIRRFADHQWSSAVAVNGAGPVITPMLRLDLAGNFTAAWRDPTGLTVRYLDSAGLPTGSSPVTINYQGFLNGSLRIGPLANGAAIVWSESLPTSGVILRAQIGTRRFTVGGASGPQQWDADVLPGGGCLLAWHQFDGSTARMKAQRYHEDGTELGVPMDLDLSVAAMGSAAVSPAGDAFAVGVAVATSTLREFELRVRRFGMTGTPLGPELVVATATEPLATEPIVVLPAVRFDFAGNLYVAWADVAGVWVRGFDAAGVAFGPAVQVASG